MDRAGMKEFLNSTSMNIKRWADILNYAYLQNEDGISTISAMDLYDTVEEMRSVRKSLNQIQVSEEDLEVENMELKGEIEKLQMAYETREGLMEMMDKYQSMIDRLDQENQELRDQLDRATQTMLEFAKSAQTLNRKVEENVDSLAVSIAIKEQKIPKKQAKLDKDSLELLYCAQKLSIQKIADMYDMTYQGVRKALINSGLKLRDDRKNKMF